MNLKSHESPRNRGRNTKSPKRSARTRQLKKRKNDLLTNCSMHNQKTLAKMFSNPQVYADELICDQLERMEKRFNYHIRRDNSLNALAVYHEYREWIDADEGDSCGFMFMEKIN